jgi:hypothetical protein
MATRNPQALPLRPVRIIAPAEFHRETASDQVTANAELEGWRHNDTRYFAGRVDELERQLRRRTWILGCALAFSLGATTMWAMPTLRALLPDLKPLTTADPATHAGNPAPIGSIRKPSAAAPDTDPPNGRVVPLRQLDAIDLPVSPLSTSQPPGPTSRTETMYAAGPTAATEPPEATPMDPAVAPLPPTKPLQRLATPER